MVFYGRVDVYWPDGPIESYRLNKPVIAIGRSTGNDIVLDTTAISRYHITLTFENQQILLEDLDSVNGTYVDGMQIPPHTPHELNGGEEIQIGDIRVIYHPPAEASPIAEDTTQRVMLSQPTYTVELEPPGMAVAPGAHVQSALVIENIGDETDRYFIEIDGLPTGWARVDRLEMEVAPGEQAQAMISFKPLRRSESTPGEYPFVVHVRSKSNPAQTIDAPTVLHILPFTGFGMALDRTTIQPGEDFKLYLHNQGSAPLTLTVQGADAARALSFQLPQQQVVLVPGERETLTGTVSPRQPKLFGKDEVRAFSLLVRSHDTSGFLAAVPGKYVHKALLPAWVPVLAVPAIALIALLLVGAVLLALGNGDSSDSSTATEVAGNASPGAPVIAAFAADVPSVAQGEAVQFTWDVGGAEQLALIVPEGAAQQNTVLAPDATGHTLVFEQTGTFVVTLQATQGDQVASATTTVEVLPTPPEILTLEISSDQLAPGETAQLSWEVQYAESIALLVQNEDGRQEYTPEPGNTTYLLDFDQPGTYTVTLEARSSAGTLSRSLSVDVTPTAPLISAFTASPPEIEAGEPVALSWTVTGAETLALVEQHGDRQTRHTLQPNATSFTLELSAPGTAVLVLEAENAQGTTTQQITVQVNAAATSAMPPAVSSFQVSAPSVTVGQPLRVSWQVRGAESLRLLALRNGEELVFPLEPDATATELELPQTGRFDLILEARNAISTTTVRETVEVRPAITLALQVVGNEALVHYVQNAVRIRWEVQEAAPLDDGYDIRLESSEPPADPLTSPQPRADSVVVQITPDGQQTDLLVTLHAIGQDEVAASLIRTLPIVYPRCDLQAASTPVRQGPGDAYEAAADPLQKPPDGIRTIRPVARDPSGEWLQFQIGVVDPPRPGWVRLDDFSCTNFDPQQLVITEDFPSLPD
jgi:PKD repeat protein